MKQILDHYEKQPEIFAYIRYDHYLEYVPTGPQVDQPDTWVIGLLGRSGGHLIPLRLHKRYMGVFLLGTALAFVPILGCLVWFFLIFGGPFSADVNVIVAGVTLLVGPLAVGGIAS